ncbi:hypothetical protein L484_017049 [Morus notabilis]|uniref:Uncharacterized protein n=1 Tax=Morus notabilis TaxID=981085 RepID=W9RKY4_9ROSA|nr:hypothetical protein L484_017049 [Morus notabilis]
MVFWLADRDVNRFCIVLWSVWNDQNLMIHSGSCRCAPKCCEDAIALFEEFRRGIEPVLVPMVQPPPMTSNLISHRCISLTVCGCYSSPLPWRDRGPSLLMSAICGWFLTSG